MSHEDDGWLSDLIAREAEEQSAATMTPAARDSQWSAIADRVGQGPLPPPAGESPIDDGPPGLPSTPAPATASAASLKLIGGVALAVGVAASLWFTRESDPPGASPVAPSEVVSRPEAEPTPPPPPVEPAADATAAEPVEPTPADAPEASTIETAPAPAPAPKAKPKAKPKPEAQSEPPPTLAEEIQLVSDIWDALQGRRHAQARKLISRHKTRFAEGQMTQERAAAEVLLLCDTGRSEAGRKARERFLKRYPESSHRSRVETACD